MPRPLTIKGATYYPTRGGLGEQPRRVLAIFGERVKYETARVMMETTEAIWNEWLDAASPIIDCGSGEVI